MLIDWFTVGAQALNFLVLVWLMKRFLYRPVLAAIDARETLIAGELADAAAQKAAAQKDRDELQQKNADLDRRRGALLKTAVDEAQGERGRLLDAARQAADALLAARQAALAADTANLHQAVSRRAQAEVFAVARRALADLATTSLEEQVGEVFVRRLRELGGQAKTDLGKALQAASEPALVRSAFPLPAGPRAAIQQALDETFAAPIAVRFATAPDLISGIELSAGGQQVAWTISEYLAALEKDVGEVLLQGKPPAAAGVMAPERALAAAGV